MDDLRRDNVRIEGIQVDMLLQDYGWFLSD